MSMKDYDPVRVINGALNAIDSEDTDHRKIHQEAVYENLCMRMGGCECVRRMHEATRLPNDDGEAARQLLGIVQRDLQCVARFRGNHGPGFGAGLAVIANEAARLARECDEGDD
jgi:hypothetical protein